MKGKARKIGNAEGIVIPKKILKEFGWKAGDKLALSIVDGVINLEAAEATESQLQAGRLGM